MLSCLVSSCTSISIHALREEGDLLTSLTLCSSVRFLSTPSARRATAASPGAARTTENFYPRPPRGGRLALSSSVSRRLTYFYPRPPRGGRPRAARRAHTSTRYFYPRPPRGGRRHRAAQAFPGLLFLSTPSARRATMPGNSICQTIEDFYPRPPRGGRPVRMAGGLPIGYFYPRPPRGGRHQRRKPAADQQQFLSTPSARRATRCRV